MHDGIASALILIEMFIEENLAHFKANGNIIQIFEIYRADNNNIALNEL